LRIEKTVAALRGEPDIRRPGLDTVMAACAGVLVGWLLTGAKLARVSAHRSEAAMGRRLPRQGASSA
jgi:hypothetical protein